MSREFTNCIKERMLAPPGFVLRWTSSAMHLYPWFMRIGLVLHRLTQ